MKLAELYESAFEEFFQDLMCLRYKDFADVRTAGNLGDLSSDGLTLVSRKLYACYGPRVFDSSRLKKKFRDDLAGAIEKREGEFDTFVFVHNDLRGIHPELTSLLSEAADSHANIQFEPFGYRQLRNEAQRLDAEDVETLLGYPLPMQMVYGVELDELVPLLEHLARTRLAVDELLPIIQPSVAKLDYNGFTDEGREELRRGIIQAPRIDEYYSQRQDVVERDEVAHAFSQEYARICNDYSDPEDIVHHLEQYVLGNASAPGAKRRAATVVLAYFFQSCDIFDNPPPGWCSRDGEAMR